MQNVKVSIIVPVYNVENYLKECLDSIEKQTYKNIEVILVNDGSVDNSAIICDYYCTKNSNFKVIHKINEGVSVARNIGLKNAIGDYCIFIDSDDYIESDMIEHMVNKAVIDSADIVLCDICLVNTNFYKENLKFRYQKYLEELDKTVNKQSFLDMLRKYPLQPYFGAPYNKLIRRKLLVDNNIIYEAFNNFAEDTCFNYKIYSVTDKITTVAKVLYYHRVDSGNSLSRLNHSYEYMKKRCKEISNLYKNLFLEYNNLIIEEDILWGLLVKYLVNSIINEPNVKMYQKVKNLKYSMETINDKHITSQLFGQKVYNKKLAYIYFLLYKFNYKSKFMIKKYIFKINRYWKLI